jgi:hypothetical protein
LKSIEIHEAERQLGFHQKNTAHDICSCLIVSSALAFCPRSGKSMETGASGHAAAAWQLQRAAFREPRPAVNRATREPEPRPRGPQRKRSLRSHYDLIKFDKTRSFTACTLRKLR